MWSFTLERGSYVLGSVGFGYDISYDTILISL